MYKFLSVLAALAVLLCLILLVGCEAQEVLEGITDKVTEAADNVVVIAGEVQDQIDAITEPDAASGTSASPSTAQETPAPAAATETAAPETASGQESTQGGVPSYQPAENGTDFTALSADDCVEDRDGLPHIALDCDGARSVNSDIEDLFRYLADSDYCTVYYEYYKNAGRVLSVMVATLYDGDASYFTPFNLDLATGQRISGHELLAILGVSPNPLADTELQIMGQEFEYEYGGLREGDTAALYEEQYQRTVDPDNADTERIWLGNDGALYFVAKIYSMAGAEYYEYPMDSGLRY